MRLACCASIAIVAFLSPLQAEPTIVVAGDSKAAIEVAGEIAKDFCRKKELGVGAVEAKFDPVSRLAVQSEMTVNVPLVLPSFETVSIKEADKAANDILEAYNKATKNLLTQLREAKTNTGKTYSIYLLGGLRAKEAVEDWVKVIDFKAETVDPSLRITRWGPYPA